MDKLKQYFFMVNRVKRTLEIHKKPKDRAAIQPSLDCTCQYKDLVLATVLWSETGLTLWQN